MVEKSEPRVRFRGLGRPGESFVAFELNVMLCCGIYSAWPLLRFLFLAVFWV